MAHVVVASRGAAVPRVVAEELRMHILELLHQPVVELVDRGAQVVED